MNVAKCLEVSHANRMLLIQKKANIVTVVGASEHCSNKSVANSNERK